MRVEIDVAVAEDSSLHNWLDRILHKIDDGWHIWDSSNWANHEALESSSWVQDRGTQGEWVRELLVAALEREAWTSAPHGRRLFVTANPREDHELAPEDAVRLLEEPLVFLVENRNSDGSFVERVVRECDKALNDLWLNPGNPIRLDSVGGIGEMPKEVERRAQEAPVRPRLVVIVDSDRAFPGAGASDGARTVSETCQTHGIACWILAKRESENYLPRALLDGRRNPGPEHSRRVDAWDDLSEDQKDFYDMKDGLSQNATGQEELLFSSLPPGDRDVLSGGFGSGVASYWTLSVPVKNQLLARGRGDLERGLLLIRGEV